MTSNKNYITKEWYAKLLTELKDYREIKLPEILERLSEAKALWDLSENFEYKSAMEDKDFVSSKISEIEKLLSNVEIISDGKLTDDTIDYGSIVTLQIEWDGAKFTVKIVWTWEVAINQKDDLSISFDSPIWHALKWHKAWEEVRMRIGNDRRKVKILSVK